MRERRSRSSWTTPGSTTPRALTNLYTPRSGPRAHHAHLHAPLRPRPWVPQNTYGTPPRTISPTPARSPRRTPSRPSPPTSPTAPSTTTSSTSQSHHHTPILFNSGYTRAGFPPSRVRSPPRGIPDRQASESACAASVGSSSARFREGSPGASSGPTPPRRRRSSTRSDGVSRRRADQPPRWV